MDLYLFRLYIKYQPHHQDIYKSKEKPLKLKVVVDLILFQLHKFIKIYINMYLFCVASNNVV